MKNIFLIAAIFLCNFSFSQNGSDTLNKYNAKKNKQGYWVIYLTDSLCIAKDKNTANYYANAYFDDGYSFDGFFCNMACSYRKKSSKFITTALPTSKGSPALLNGNFKYYDTAGNIMMNETYVNGEPTIIESYMYDKKGGCSSKTIFNYIIKYKNQRCSYLVENYAYDKLKETYYYAKNSKGKWRAIK